MNEFIHSFIKNQLCTAPWAQRERYNSHLPLQVQPGLKHFSSQKQDGLQVPNAPPLVASTRLTQTTLHWWSEIGTRHLKASLSWTRRKQAPLTPAVRIWVEKRAGENPEHAAFTLAGSLSTAAATESSRGGPHSPVTRSDSAWILHADRGLPGPETRPCTVRTRPPSMPSCPVNWPPTPHTSTFWRAPQTPQQSKCPPGRRPSPGNAPFLDFHWINVVALTQVILGNVVQRPQGSTGPHTWITLKTAKQPPRSAGKRLLGRGWGAGWRVGGSILLMRAGGGG